jgi:hypothetical protein
MLIAYQDQVPEYIVQQLGNAQLAKYFWDEYKKRQYAELAAALRDQERVSIENYKAEMRPHELLGECTFRIAQSLSVWIGRRFGWELSKDPAFIKELIRDNQGLLGVTHTHDLLFKPTQEKRLIVTKTRDLN